MRSKNILWLQGGLGNQLFQVNAAEYISSEAGCGLRISRSSYLGDRLRNYELPTMDLGINLATLAQEIVAGRPYSRKGNLKDKVGLLRRPVITDLQQVGSGAFIVGFFQDSASLNLSTESLVQRLESIRARIAKTPRGKAASGRPVIHVRRGDYATSPAAQSMFGTLDRGYYERALKAIGAEFDDVVIFTDDPKQVSFEFGITPSRIFGPSSSYTDIENLLCMSLAGALVIPNSTYSWWSAEIAGANVPVAAPETWFVEGGPGSTLARPHWIPITNSLAE